jgi:hypothetical protein
MFSISEKSQVKRLENILVLNKILVDGKIVNEVNWNRDSLPDLIAKSTLTNDNIISDSLKNEVRSILNYLNESHGFKSIQGWYQQDMDSLESGLKNAEVRDKDMLARLYMQTMGLDYNTTYNTQREIIFNYEFFPTGTQFSDISGYDYAVKLNSYPDRESNDSLQTFYINDSRYDLKFIGNEGMKLFMETEKGRVEFNLAEWYKKNKDRYNPTFSEDMEDSSETEQNELITLQGSSSKLKAKMELNSLLIEKEGDIYSIVRLDGTLFLDLK